MNIRVVRAKWYALVTFDVYPENSEFRMSGGYIDNAKRIRKVTIGGNDCDPQYARDYATAILSACDAVEQEPFE